MLQVKGQIPQLRGQTIAHVIKKQYLCIGFRKHPVPSSQTLSKQRAFLTRFEQGFNEVFKNPLQREIVVFGRIIATAISPQGDINYSLFIIH